MNPRTTYLEALLVDVSGHEVLDGLGRVRGDLARLHHHAVARRDRARHGRQRQVEWVVPRPDHEDHAEGLGHREGTVQDRGERLAHVRRLHPLADLPAGRKERMFGCLDMVKVSGETLLHVLVFENLYANSI